MTFVFFLLLSWFVISVLRQIQAEQRQGHAPRQPLIPGVVRRQAVLRLRRSGPVVLVGTAAVVAGGVFWGGAGLVAGTLVLAGSLVFAASRFGVASPASRFRLFRRRRSAKLSAWEQAEFEAIVRFLQDVEDL